MASSFSAESWLEAAGAVAAENQALDFIRQLAGMPEGSGGCFTFGGSNGNLSAIAVARDVAGGRRLAAVADTAHASVDNSLRLLGHGIDRRADRPPTAGSRARPCGRRSTSRGAAASWRS